MIEYDGETYVTVSDVARQFHISRGTVHNNLLHQLQKCYLPGRKHALYKQSEVEQFAGIRREHHQRISPVSPVSAEETRDGVTSSPTTFAKVELAPTSITRQASQDKPEART